MTAYDNVFFKNCGSDLSRPSNISKKFEYKIPSPFLFVKEKEFKQTGAPFLEPDLKVIPSITNCDDNLH